MYAVCALSAVTVSVRLKKRAESSRGKIDGVPRCVVYAIGSYEARCCGASYTTEYNNDEEEKKISCGGKSLQSRKSRIDRDLGI